MNGGQSGLGYTGEWWDAAVGLQYLRARWYDPQTGRFTTPDTIISDPWTAQGWNRYVYVSNTPILYVDPSGHIGLLGFMGAFAIAGGLFSGAAYAKATRPQDFDWGQFAVVAGTGAVAGALIGTGVGASGALVLSEFTGLMSIEAAAVHMVAGTGMLTAGLWNIYEQRNETFDLPEYMISSCIGGIDGAATAAIGGVGLAPTLARALVSGVLGTGEYIGQGIVQGSVLDLDSLLLAFSWAATGGAIGDVIGQTVFQNVSLRKFALGNLNSPIYLNEAFFPPKPLDMRALDKTSDALMKKALLVEAWYACREMGLMITPDLAYSLLLFLAGEN